MSSEQKYQKVTQANKTYTKSRWFFASFFVDAMLSRLDALELHLNFTCIFLANWDVIAMKSSQMSLALKIASARKVKPGK